jgi:hypothetical protein
MNRQDVEMFLGSMRGMGESFAQQDQREVENELKQKQLDAEMERYKSGEQHYKAEEKHYSNIEEKQDAILQHQQSQDAVKNLSSAYDKLLQQLQNGQIDEEQFNRQAKATVDGVYDANHTILQNTPFGPWANDPAYRVRKGNPANTLTPGRVGNRDVAIGPKGSVNYTDTFAPADKAELDDASQNLRDVQNQLNKIAPDSTGNYSEAQAAQIHRLSLQKQEHQARRLAVLQNYQRAAAGPTGGGMPSPGGGMPSPGGPAAATGTAQDPNALRQQAKQAISGGKDPVAVKARFKQLTGQDL